MEPALSTDWINRRIHVIRGHRVMLDEDLAVIYGVSTRRLNEQVRRNVERFPSDFMFQVTSGECRRLMSQNATSSSRWGGRRKLPFVFTQEGVSMLSGVLRSPRAVQANVAIMRAFIRLREMLPDHQALSRRLEELERKYDARFAVVFKAIRGLMNPPEPARRRIGFRPD